MPTNTAAWINARGGQLEVSSAPYPTPGADQVVVQSRAVAINPLDWIIQIAGSLAYRWLKYPAVLGADVAGEVVEIGTDVTRFKIGDRVLGHLVGTDKDCNSPAEGAFQHYAVVLERLTAAIPDSLSFTSAAVLPLGISTAACSLFQKDHLGLNLPSGTPVSTGETVLVWGGSTSVGSNAIQLAVAAGYEVITTASPRNVDYLKSLGATAVFDYSSPTVVADIIAAFKSRTLAGAIAIGTTSAPACVRIVGACTGRKFVSIASPPVSFESLGEGAGRLAVPRLMRRFVTSNVALQVSARRRRVGTKFIFGTTLKSNEVGPAIYRDFLPAALAEGRYVAAPNPQVVGNGLGEIQRAMEIHRRGVSAAKVVVTLP